MVSYEIDFEHNFIYTKDEAGKYHSFFGNPAIEYTDRKLYIWYTHGVINRDIEEGPAYLSDDEAKYFVNGKLHNFERYPAVIRRTNKYCLYEYWTNGSLVKKLTKSVQYLPLTNCFTYNEQYENEVKTGICEYTHIFVRIIYKPCKNFREDNFIPHEYIKEDDSEYENKEDLCRPFTKYYSIKEDITRKEIPDKIKKVIIKFSNKPQLNILQDDIYNFVRCPNFAIDNYKYIIDSFNNNIYSYSSDNNICIKLAGVFLGKTDSETDLYNSNYYRFNKIHIKNILPFITNDFYKAVNKTYSLLFWINPNMNLTFNTTNSTFDLDQIIKFYKLKSYIKFIPNELFLHNTVLEIIFSQFFTRHLLSRFCIENFKLADSTIDNIDFDISNQLSLNFDKFGYLEMISIMIEKKATPYVDIQYKKKTVNLIELINICKIAIQEKYDKVIQFYNNNPDYIEEKNLISDYMDKMVGIMSI